MEQVTRTIMDRLPDEPQMVGTAANDYLHLLGYLSYAYMWATMAQKSIGKTADAFHDGKVKTGLFFMQRLLPQMNALAVAIVQGVQSTMSLSVEQF